MDLAIAAFKEQHSVVLLISIRLRAAGKTIHGVRLRELYRLQLPTTSTLSSVDARQRFILANVSTGGWNNSRNGDTFELGLCSWD